MQSSNRNLKIAGLLVLVMGLMSVGNVSAEDPSDGLVPTVRLDVPGLSSLSAITLPTSFTFPLVGVDPVSPTGRPVKYRYALVSAQYDTTETGEPRYIRTPFEYAAHGADVLSWDDPGWTAWEDYPEAPDPDPVIDVTDLVDDVYYLMALQVMDADGAVSVDLNYQLEVFNFWVREGAFAPEVTICETYLGCPSASQVFNEIAGGQPLNFSWIASAEAYGGEIVSYRHGWDLIDPEDPNDPGWAVPPGLAPENMFADERIFMDGIHTFILRVEDSAHQVRLITWGLQVVPFVSMNNQFPLLVIDQTVDTNSNAWPDENGYPRDNAVYRNPYWQFLAESSGGVSFFDWDRDRIDHTQEVSYSDLVMYKAVLCYARAHTNQTMFQQFRPVNGQDKYVWLAPYQWRGGNYFQVGNASMESYLETLLYMIPVIFDANETVYLLDGQTFTVGFGQKELPDGTMIPRGPTMYPYATAGIAALDWTSPNSKNIYGRPDPARFDRKVDCVGLKGLVLDPDFRANHAVDASAIADTFFTDMVIDWHDVVDAGSGNLELFSNTFSFRNDEFVNSNISPRTTPIIPQECLNWPGAPGGMCVEPMFTGIARMDWMREYMWNEGDPDWPFSTYTDTELIEGCGSLGMTSYQDIPHSSALTNGQTYGYFSYKMTEDKPSGKADVYWGFDPYRFDPDETKKAIRWVLDYFGLQINP